MDIENLSQENRAFVEKKGNPDLNKTLDMHRNLESKLGSMTSIPGEDATPEEKSKFYDKMGRPSSPEGYAVSETVFDAAAKKAMFENGIPLSAAKKLEEVFSQNETRQAAILKEKLRSDAKALSERFGPEEFKQKITKMKEITQALDWSEEQTQVMVDKFGLEKVLKNFESMGSFVGESRLKGKTFASSQKADSLAEFRSKNGEILTNPSHPKHSMVLRQYKELQNK